MRVLTLLGWICVGLDLVAAATLVLARDGGDAATRGLGHGFGALIGALAALAAALLFFGGRGAGHGIVPAVGTVLAALPVVLAVGFTTTRSLPALIYPSLRERDVPREASPRYAFPDAAGREAAMALVMQDYATLDTLLRATPAPDLTARDERGVSLLGIAVQGAIMQGGTMRDLDGLRLLVAAGARAHDDDLGPDVSLLETVAGAAGERGAAALALLRTAGLDPNTPMKDGRSILFHPRLTPEAARVLLAQGADRTVHDARGGGPTDWSPVTYQADLRNWATALALLEGGVPRDHGAPPGAVLARVLRHGESRTTPAERADAAYRAFMAAVGTPPGKPAGTPP